MGFRFRKSFRIIPGVRLNFSKSGTSVSFGGRGFTYNVGPKGTRKTLSIPGTGLSWSEYSPHSKHRPSASNVPTSLPPIPIDSTPLTPIESAPVESVGAMSTSELAPILSAVSQKIAVAPFIGGGGALLCAAAHAPTATPPLVVGTLVLTAIAFALDKYRRSVAIEYEPTGIASESSEAIGKAFDTLRSVERIWRVEADAHTSDWKRHAGATSLNKRGSMHLAPSRPRSIRGVASFPAFLFGRQKLYLLPDAALFVDGRSVTALHYRDLDVSQRDINFIEDERVPGDTVVVGTTWRFVNRNGGPDRRFNNNRQLPVCRYNELDLTSQGGLRGRIHLSRPAGSETFAKVIETLGRFLDTDSSLKPVRSYRRPKTWPTIALVGFALAFFSGVALLTVPIKANLQPTSQTAPSENSPATTNAPATTRSTNAGRSAKAAGQNSNDPLVIVPPTRNDSAALPAVPTPHLRPRNSTPSQVGAPMVLQPP